MRIRPRLALLAALAPLATGLAAAQADPVDDLRRLLTVNEVCVSTPPAATVVQLCTDGVRRTLDDLDPPTPAYPEYVVVLKEPRPASSASPLTAQATLQGQLAAQPDIAAARAERDHGAEIRYVYRHALRGYAAALSPEAYGRISRDPAVKYVQRVGWGEIVVDQPNPTWGLDRIDQRNLPLDSNYHYHATGVGVKAYIVDTGIEYTHPEFAGRAVPGFDAVNAADGAVDCHGHGTHVAGTVGGTTYGVAKNVQLVGVRVVNCWGSGSTAQYAAGLDWMVQDHLPGQPAVANVSLHYFTVDPVVDDATTNAIVDGIAVSVAAANDDADACYDSPSNVPLAMTVGATDITDTRAWFSNWGPCVDWFAPGVNIDSAWLGGSSAPLDGTSMASPHTAGVAAQVLQADPTLNPFQVRNAIYAMTTKNIVGNANSTNPHLLFTEVLVHLAAVGTIDLQRSDAGVYSWDTTGVFDTDFICGLWTVGTVRVECSPKPSNTVVWHCNAWGLSAAAPAPGSTGPGNVKGWLKCDDPAVLQTADVTGAGAQVTWGTNMGTAGLVICRAAGTGSNAMPSGSYHVNCDEPGVERPLAPGGYQRAQS